MPVRPNLEPYNNLVVRNGIWSHSCDTHLTIHKTNTFYECFGRVKIVKNIHYHILEFTRIVHVFWNIEF